MSTTEPVNILLVDDQPAKLLSYEAVLRELGETLLTAGSAREALGHLLKKDVAVVLIDVCMPELDGFELAAMIRDHPRFQTTAIIFVSAVALTDLDRLKGYEHGAVDYVPVPVVPGVLRAKVRVFAELYRKTRQLERLNAELELRVAARTEELAQANADLEKRVEERTRERESALAQVHEMQKLESLGHLTGGVAHDFNNLLMVILANLDLVSRNLPKDTPDRRLIDRATLAAERGAALTKRMLAFARRQELKPEAVNVTKLIDGSTAILRSSLGPGIDIEVELETELAPARVDPNQLELAILNLALNARDAMPQGGRLTIAARRLQVGADSVLDVGAGEYVCISVTDTGTGMDEATLARAAEPFFTTKGVGKGTGLGLSIVFGLAAQSGGTARISSTPGVGTTVELWLPVAGKEDAHQVQPMPATIGAPAQSYSILLVDDDPLVTQSTVGMLQELGHRVLVAPSGASAFDVIRQDSQLDLVITDHAMPGMTGMELAGRIRAVRPKLPIVLATGYAQLPGGPPPEVPRIDKPYRLEDLALVIATLVERPAPPPPAPAALPDEKRPTARTEMTPALGRAGLSR
jgi:signal transduction histidine kinase